MAENETDSKMRVTMIVVVALVVLIGVVAIVSSRPASQQTAVDADEEDKTAAKREDVLDSAWSMLQPERFRVTSDRGAIVAALNEWLSLADETPGDDLSEADRRHLARLLTPEDLGVVEQERFTAIDADHIGTCLIERAISEHATEGVDGNLERAVALFDYVCRNLVLEDPAQHLPSTRFQRMLLGRGIAADRAQLFANVLRQLQIDCVIVRPTADGQAAPDAKDYWLLGVLLDDEVYLFDPHLGMPVPSPQDEGSSITVQLPATLAQAINDESVLRQLDLSDDDRYPLSAADLRKPQIELMGNPSLWSPIMKRLQRYLSGDRSVVVYDGLLDEEGVQGLQTRVAAFAGTQWDPEKTAVWPYPSEQLAAMTRTDSPEYEALGRKMRRFNVPLERLRVDVDNLTVVFGESQRAQLKNRISQLLGEEQQAITVYLAIRVDGELPPQFKIDDTTREMHTTAVDDASFWIGLCQYELGEYRAAAETFRNYIKLYGGQSVLGAWVDAAQQMLAICLAREGRVTEATLHLTALDDELPRHRGARLLLKRWRDMLQPSEEADSDSNSGE